MIFLAPALLLGLLALPAIWWLVRATPPAPQERRFPSLILLEKLTAKREDAARAPLWLLLLRVAAVALTIIGLAQPIFVSRDETTQNRPLVITLDDGWAAAPHWNERVAAVLAFARPALRSGQSVTLLRAARAPDGSMPEPFTTRDAHDWAGHVGGLQPRPWPVDRSGLARLLSAQRHDANVVTLSDGLATPDDDGLASALTPFHAVQDMRWSGCDVLLLRAGPHGDGSLHAQVESPDCVGRKVILRAVARNGGTLATFPLKTGPAGSDQPITLPALLRNQLDRLTLQGRPGPATTWLTGEADQRRPVGILQTPGDSTPLVGSAFFLDRALGPIAELRPGDATTLLGAPLSVLIANDGALSGETTRAKVLAWVQHGGMLIRFSGPGLAAEQADAAAAKPDALLPVRLMSGMRQLGGSMSWGAPQKLAPFPEHSPFDGLRIPAEVTVSRQVLARPETGLDDHVWAALSDGTPLVTARSEGNGTVVLFHVTASPDWSSLPLSGLFPQMLQRLIERSAGVAGTGPNELLPWRILSTDGTLISPPPAARGIARNALARTAVDVAHPAGLYGPAHGTHALNLANTMPPLRTERLLGTPLNPDRTPADRPLGPSLLIAGLALLLLDLLLSLRRRGLLGPLTLILLLGSGASALAQSALAQSAPAQSAQAQTAAPATVPATVPQAALETRLGYILTGHDDIDTVSREGLEGLSHYVTTRSSVTLGKPDGVTPGKDDLAFYPLLYWPITADAQPDPARTRALNSYMDHGGIILIDEQGAGSTLDGGSGAAVRAALQRVTDGLTIPPLARLTDKHVLAHTFYLLHGFQGRYANQPVYVARNGDEANDDVSPVIIGNSDWAHAWAVDPSGGTPFACVPGGEDQRTQAYRFGVNVVLYALTGNYKSDQAHYPEMLRRLGNAGPDGASSPQTTDQDEEDAP